MSGCIVHLSPFFHFCTWDWQLFRPYRVTAVASQKHRRANWSTVPPCSVRELFAASKLKNGLQQPKMHQTRRQIIGLFSNCPLPLSTATFSFQRCPAPSANKHISSQIGFSTQSPDSCCSQGSVKAGGTWVPDTYQRAQQEAVKSFYSHNGWVALDSLQRAGIPVDRASVEETIVGGTLLDTTIVSPGVLAQADMGLQEVASSGTW